MPVMSDPRPSTSASAPGESHPGGGSLAPTRRPTLIVLAALIGLVVGAGVVGGVWAIRGGTPAPISITRDILPTEVVGHQRDDLALQSDDNTRAQAQGKRLSKLWVEQIDAYRKAYGGPGIQGTYGGVEGDQTITLTLVNGMQAPPRVTPDSVIAYRQYLGSVDGVEAPGSSTTQCVAQPGAAGLPVKDAADVSAVRKKVLGSAESRVTCVRADRSKNFSVSLVWLPRGDGGPAASKQSVALAEEVDRIWESVVD